MPDPTAPRPVSVESPGNDGFRYERPTAPEHHDPPADATCGERIAILGTAHACRWAAHDGHSHACVCGVRWEPRELGCTTAPVAPDDLTTVARWAEANGGPGSLIQAAARRLLGVIDHANYRASSHASEHAAAAGDLRERIAEALIARIKASVIIDPVKQPGTVGQPLAATEYDLADAVLAALAGDPGDLPARMAAELNNHEWEPSQRHTAHRKHNYHGACAICQEDLPRIAAVAMSVRWEHAASQAVEVERLRAELAEAKWSALDTARKIFGLGTLILRVELGVSRKRAERAEAERDALKAAVQHLAAEAHRRKWAHEHAGPGAFEELHRIGNELLADLPAPQIPACLTAAPESHEDAPADITDAHGRTWDPHPFVQSRAVDNVRCICGQPPDHRIHAPEAAGDWLKRVTDGSLAAARDKFGREVFPETTPDAPTERNGS